LRKKGEENEKRREKKIKQVKQRRRRRENEREKKIKERRKMRGEKDTKTFFVLFREAKKRSYQALYNSLNYLILKPLSQKRFSMFFRPGIHCTR